MYKKLAKWPNFTWYLPEELSKCPNVHDSSPYLPDELTKFPNFTWYLPEIQEFYMIIARKKIFFFTNSGGGTCPPPSLTSLRTKSEIGSLCIAKLHTFHGITQCYPLPDTSERAPPQPQPVSWYSIDAKYSQIHTVHRQLSCVGVGDVYWAFIKTSWYDVICLHVNKVDSTSHRFSVILWSF